MKISRTTIFNIIQRYKNDPTTLENRPKTGRPQILDKFEQKLIIRKCLAQPNLNSTQLLASLELSQKVSTSYVRKLLLRNGLHAKVCTSKPFLSRANRLKRDVWAKDMLQKSDLFGKMCCFRSKQWLSCSQNGEILSAYPNRVEFRISSRQKYVCQHAKFGGKKMRFWGFIKESGERKLIKVENRVNSSVYTSILAYHLLPHMYLGEVLQQAHKSAETCTSFLENGVDVLENWPLNSPDLNIIENLWSILKGRVAKRHPKTLEDLETFALEKFYVIPDEYVQKLFKSIKNRLILTKINRGGFTRYWKLQYFT